MKSKRVASGLEKSGTSDASSHSCAGWYSLRSHWAQHFLPFERLRDEICKKGSCFVCGSPRGRDFNDEHVIPNWLQRHCGLHKETLTLPNGVRVKQGTHKTPCCEECNRLLGDIYETPISKPAPSVVR